MAKICHRRRIAVFSTVLTAAWLVGIADSFTSAPPLVREFRFSGRLQATKAADDDTEEERNEKMEKALKAMTNFSNKYISTTQTKYCQDKSIAAVVIKGLAEHKVSLGTPLCPCRFYEDKEAEAKDGYWNCPCTPMRERHECHCMLFLTDDNQFAGPETNISIEEVKDLSGGFTK
ncbi:hypothetical protein THAOC_16667 [Thalassiosira oceanica]|uniref:ferredoxin:thioredoxin reductase n=1 Tax=Thalassiosira oceanica TaxID=159749 RepID=K0SWZ7_THAOC|nr:hypothetical protein THAOC_16667 [Thalassiosira oceanica]|eukprot:EJK62707.1 hypothetical protein THAOC_16667 [Thalassiosira oceanica]